MVCANVIHAWEASTDTTHVNQHNSLCHGSRHCWMEKDYQRFLKKRVPGKRIQYKVNDGIVQI